MTIHDLALETVDMLIAQTVANKRARGEWWDAENYTPHIPTEAEEKSKAASIKRRRDKAKEAYFATLTEKEKEWEAVLDSSENRVHIRRKVYDDLMGSIGRDPQKAALRDTWTALCTQYMFEGDGI